MSVFKYASLLPYFFLLSTVTFAQAEVSIDDIRWKTNEAVRALYGEPESVTEPVGTHASYVIWKYSDYSIAFANGRAFHVFSHDSLRRVRLNPTENE